ncbi:MAG: hypothetical protein ACI4KR_04690 [Ruminiclostridium sp.]
MKRKLLFLFLTAAILLSASGCGIKPAVSMTETQTAAMEATTAGAEASTTPCTTLI